MKKSKKVLSKLFLIVALCISLFAIAENNKAAALEKDDDVTPFEYRESVLYAWKNEYKPFNYDTDYDKRYKTITFVKGFKHKETTRDISTLGDRLMGVDRTQHNRTYTTY